MADLWLNFIDLEGEPRRVRVEGSNFVLGRQSSCDLCVPDGRLSREHARIDRYGDVFVVADLGSSNGTFLNGKRIEGSIGLTDGDRLDLGGGVTIDVELAFDNAGAPPPEFVQQAAAPPPAQPVAEEGGGIPMIAFVVAPLLGLIVLIFAGGLIFLLSSSSTPGSRTVAKDTNFEDDFDDLEIRPIRSPTPDAKTPTSTGPSQKDGPKPDSPPPTPISKDAQETAKVEQHGAAFLRRIASNDPKAFLTADQAKRVNAKIKQISGSPTLAMNLNAARQNSAQLTSMAQSKNLRPQFLAIAAVARLGNSKGDVVQTAQGMLDVLDRLGTQIGNELADDALLMIAAYGQGSAGEFLKMRNMLQDIAQKSKESSREIRSIWYLERNRRITPAEFESALNFLAIGTISQAPKDFGVNADPLAL
jgi:hypothetical protein